MAARIFYLFAAVLVFGCQSRHFDNEQELRTYLEEKDNGLSVTKSVNGVQFKLSFTPTDLMVLNELEDPKNGEQVTKLREKYAQNLYFNLSISKQKRELLSDMSHGRNGFARLVNTLSFGLDESVHLFTSQRDTLPLIDFVYPRMYGMSQSTNVMFVFRDELINEEGDLNFVFQDIGLGTGDIRFKLPAAKILEEPTLLF